MGIKRYGQQGGGDETSIKREGTEKQVPKAGASMGSDEMFPKNIYFFLFEIGGGGLYSPCSAVPRQVAPKCRIHFSARLRDKQDTAERASCTTPNVRTANMSFTWSLRILAQC